MNAALIQYSVAVWLLSNSDLRGGIGSIETFGQLSTVVKSLSLQQLDTKKQSEQ
ncbi:hypothetical protein [Porphyromonas gulae]|uniref:hypothetical protein n=1 Tax=Porphyromonas gulae TaxID=111105 RepID=UPI0012D30F2C|nr:hypothetical protein [Porphyromonas gulae]